MSPAIIGADLGGLPIAHSLATICKVTLICKCGLPEGASDQAQGDMVAVLDSIDCTASHLKRGGMWTPSPALMRTAIRHTTGRACSKRLAASAWQHCAILCGPDFHRRSDQGGGVTDYSMRFGD
jgi:glycine/D-amino acid oxidase-like deaminating enzyme